MKKSSFLDFVIRNRYVIICVAIVLVVTFLGWIPKLIEIAVTVGLVLLATAIAPALQASTVLYFLMYALIAYFMYGISLNCGLFLFNLIPLYPLDGSRVFELIVGPHSKAAVFMRNYGRYILWGLILLGFIGIDILGAVIQGGGSLILGGFGWFWEMIFGLFGV